MKPPRCQGGQELFEATCSVKQVNDHCAIEEAKTLRTRGFVSRARLGALGPLGPLAVRTPPLSLRCVGTSDLSGGVAPVRPGLATFAPSRGIGGAKRRRGARSDSFTRGDRGRTT